MLRLAEREWEEAGVKLGRSMVAYATAFLLWLFLLAVFLPAASAPLSESLAPVIALIFLLGIAVEVYWGTTNLLEFLDLSRPGKVARFLTLELIVALDALLLAAPLYAISPALGGACIVVASVVAVMILLTHSEAFVELILRLITRSGE